MTVFPYFATPNTEVQIAAESVELAAPPDAVWSVIGQFNLDWHPHVAKVRLVGDGIGQLRRIETRDGREIVERLEDVDNVKQDLPLQPGRRDSRLPLPRRDRSEAEGRWLHRGVARRLPC